MRDADIDRVQNTTEQKKEANYGYRERYLVVIITQLPRMTILALGAHHRRTRASGAARNVADTGVCPVGEGSDTAPLVDPAPTLAEAVAPEAVPPVAATTRRRRRRLLDRLAGGYVR